MIFKRAKYWPIFCFIFIFGTFHTAKADTGLDGSATSSSSFSITGLVSISSLTVNNISASGNISFSSTSLYGIIGSSTSDNAAAGNVGEYIASLITNVSFPTSNTWGDATSVILSSGDWDVTASYVASVGATNWSDVEIGISTTTGNSSALLFGGQTSSRQIFAATATQPSQVGLTISNVRISLASRTVTNMKYLSIYNGVPQIQGGRLSARRMR